MMIGTAKIRLSGLPAHIPLMMENKGLITKNKMKQMPMPASVAKVTARKGQPIIKKTADKSQ